MCSNDMNIINIILEKRLNNINNKKMWDIGLTDEECKAYNRYYMQQSRLKPETIQREKEYYELNRERINETKKKYYEDNKQKFQEKRDNNKEKTREYMKEYNLNRIRPDGYEERRKEKIFCECGSLIRRSNMRLHIITPKHEQTLKAKNSQTKE